MAIATIELLRSARDVLEANFGPAAVSVSVSIRDGAGREIVFSMPVELLTPAEPATQMQADIVESLTEGGPLQGRELAKKTGYVWNSHFREVLAAMRRNGLIAGGEDGYRVSAISA
jgi:hypothetical protein